MEQTVMEEINLKFNESFDKQKFLDWLSENKARLLKKEQQQLNDKFDEGYNY